jgi:hypothetical protein
MGHAVWQDYADAFDEVLATNVGPIDKALANLRTLYPGYVDYDALAESNSALATAVVNGELLPPAAFDTFSRDVEVQRLNTLGLSVTDPRAMDDAALRRLTQNIGMYWYSKGTVDLPDFLSFCLNSPIRLVPLWTLNYKDMYEEGDPLIGTPVWQGGEWFPTTHVRLHFDTAEYTGSNLDSLISVLYDLINYNLVVESITRQQYFVAYSSNNPTVTEPYPDEGNLTLPWDAPVWQAGLLEMVTQTIYPF